MTVKDSGGNVVTLSSTDVGSGTEAMNHRVTDATAAHFLPTGDAVGRTIYVTLNDTTNAITVKPASTGALAGDTALVVRPMAWTDGTNTAPTMDAIARAGFQELTDGTTGPVAVKAASTRAAATDKALVVRTMAPTDGTHDMPTADAVGRALYVTPTDGVNAATVKAASTPPALTDTSLVISISPVSSMTAAKQRNLAATVQAIKASGGHLYGLQITNSQAATACYVQLFNVASGSVTMGTTTPDLEVYVPAVTSLNWIFPDGIPFGTAISIASTTTEGGATGSAAGVMVFLQYA